MGSMNDTSASERRLIAALDRIDRALDSASTRRRADTDAAARLAEAEAEVARLTAQLAEVEAARESLQGAAERAHGEADSRCASATAEVARLAAANDELAAANRALLAQSDGDSSRAAIEAELGALQAARAAEVAQMGDILAALEALRHTLRTTRPQLATELVFVDQPEAAHEAVGAIVAAGLDEVGIVPP